MSFLRRRYEEIKKVLSIHNLTIHFTTIDGISQVLKGVDIDIEEGEIVGLVGETGCGKSIVAKTILGILPTPPSKVISGEVCFLNNDLLKLHNKERQMVKNKIGYIPQDPMTSLNPVFPIREILVDALIWQMNNMSFTRYFYQRRLKTTKKIAEEHILEILQKVNLHNPQEVLGKYPLELSGGMKQRILIAMSLICNPALIIADEPTTALDVTIQKAILKLLLAKIKEEKISGLYITHDLGVAREICNRTYIIYAGTVIEMAKTPILLDKPLHPYTRGLVNSIPKLTGEEYEGIPGSVISYFNPPIGCRFHSRCDYRLQDCSRKKPKLQEVQKGHFVACHYFNKKGNKL